MSGITRKGSSHFFIHAPFAAGLEAKGHRVAYLAIDDPMNLQSVPDNLSELARRYGATRTEFQEPDEHRLDRQLQDYRTRPNVTTVRVPSEHLYTERLEARDLFDTQPHWLLVQGHRPPPRRSLGVSLRVTGRR